VAAAGTPEQVSVQPASWTGRYLAELLERQSARRGERRKRA
jgi:excinuclease ABC subunit A